MSAFVVEDKTVNVVVTKLAYDRDGDWLKRKFSERGYDLDTLEGKQKLGWDLFKLNIKSVHERYGDGEAEKFRPLNYRFALEGNYPKVSALKALKCWLYQSCEGGCDEIPLYKLMEEVSHLWAMDIVRSMPQYETAKMWN